MTRLSYIVYADEPGVIHDLAQALARQTVVDAVQLVVVSPVPLEIEVPDALSASVVAAPSDDLGAARAAGVRAALGDVVALGETHVVPDREWAGTVLEAHDSGATAVLPRMCNGNGSSALSWASFLMDYGRYTGDVPVTTPVPTFNATISREALLALPDIDRALSRGLDLDKALRTRGATVAHAQRAVLAHVNIDRPVHWAVERALGGVLLARSRVSSFGPLRRLLYTVAAPLIGATILARALRCPRGDAPRGTLVALAFGSALWAGGEAIGYVVHVGGWAERRMGDYETRKRSYTRAGS